jgi:hypothetical protein
MGEEVRIIWHEDLVTYDSKTIILKVIDVRVALKDTQPTQSIISFVLLTFFFHSVNCAIVCFLLD